MIVGFDSRRGIPLIREDRAPRPWRAVPVKVRDRIEILERTGAWQVRYQSWLGRMITERRCWKCARPIIGWAPALDKTGNMIQMDGRPAVTLLPYNHYREGRFAYQTAWGSRAEFTYLHCADCVIEEADGENLFACFLAGLDEGQQRAPMMSHDEWAQYLWHFSGATLIEKLGASQSLQEMMAENR